MDDVGTEKLDAHFRKRITPEIVEWMRRRVPTYDPLASTSDSSFGHAVGWNQCRLDLIANLERLLTENQSPEFR
jgi:hypothetical protein